MPPYSASGAVAVRAAAATPWTGTSARTHFEICCEVDEIQVSKVELGLLDFDEVDIVAVNKTWSLSDE